MSKPTKGNPHRDDPAYRKAAWIKRMQMHKTLKKEMSRIEWNGGFDAVHDYAAALRRGGRADLADQELADLYAAMQREKPLGNPKSREARKLTEDARLAWRVTIELDDVYLKSLDGRKRAPRTHPLSGEANKRFDDWYAQACANLTIDPDKTLQLGSKRKPKTVPLQDAVASRWQQGRTTIDLMRKRFDKEAMTISQDSNNS